MAWMGWFIATMLLAAAVGGIMLLQGPAPAVIAWLIFFLGAAAILIQPRYGVYLVVFFALAGDTILLAWYPFAKNFSSSESLLFINNKVIFSPLEVYLVLTLASWLVRDEITRRLKIFTGALFGRS